MLKLILDALVFAAEKHQYQRRNGFDELPYVNHLIKVAHQLFNNGESENTTLLVAAVLHDCLEDTDATEREISQKFGPVVMNIVKELTDDMSRPYNDRKKSQIEGASGLSDNAKKLRIADKTCNIRDIMNYPLSWDDQKIQDYIYYSEKVVDLIRGISPELEAQFDQEVKLAKNKLNG